VNRKNTEFKEDEHRLKKEKIVKRELREREERVNRK
jgi:hypothetical protein